MQCTGWRGVQGFALWVGIFLALWRLEGWVIIWSFLVRFWVSFWCVVYFIMKSVEFMHEGLCGEFMMFGLIVEMFFLGKA